MPKRCWFASRTRKIYTTAYDIELNGTIIKEEVIQLLEQSRCHCFRIKGFVSCVEGDFLIQMASDELQLTPCENKDNKIVFLYSSYKSSREKIIDIFGKSKLLNIKIL